MARFFVGLLACACMLVLGSCASAGEMTAEDSAEIQGDFFSAEFDRLVGRLTDQMLNSSFAQRAGTGDNQPTIGFYQIDNKTDETDVTEGVYEAIKHNLVNADRFVFVPVDDATMRRHMSLLKEQQSDLFDPASVAALGKMYGTQYMISGKLLYMRSKDGRTTKTQFQLVLELVEVERRAIRWSGQEIFRKSVTRSMFRG